MTSPVASSALRTIGMRLLEGRDVTAQDRSGQPEVAIVNDASYEMRNRMNILLVNGAMGLVLVAMIVCLALEEKIHAKKSIIVGVFATICLLLGEIFGLLHRDPVEFLGHAVDLPVQCQR